MICSIHLVRQIFFNFFFKQTRAWFSVELSNFFWHGSEKFKKEESSLIWPRTFLTYWILHDVTITRFNQWLWQWVYTAFSLILGIWAERLLIWPETGVVSSYSRPRQLLISTERFPISARIVSAKNFPDKPNTQFKKSKHSSLISPSLSTNLKRKDNRSWYEWSDQLKLKQKYFLLCL